MFLFVICPTVQWVLLLQCFSTDLSKYVLEVRASRGNSLTGLKIQEIVTLVQTAILKEKAMNEQKAVNEQMQKVIFIVMSTTELVYAFCCTIDIDIFAW